MAQRSDYYRKKYKKGYRCELNYNEQNQPNFIPQYTQLPPPSYQLPASLHIPPSQAMNPNLPPQTTSDLMFKSLILGINKSSDLKTHPIITVFRNENKLERKYKDLIDEYEIKPELVDRVYYLHHCESEYSGRFFQIIARMIYKTNTSMRYFINMDAFINPKNSKLYGDIDIIGDPNTFFNEIKNYEFLSADRKQSIYLSLLEDGYSVR